MKRVGLIASKTVKGGGAVDDRGPAAGTEPSGDPDDDHVGTAAVAYTEKGRQAAEMTCRAGTGWKGSRILTGAVRKSLNGIVDGDFPAGYPFIG